MKKLLLTFAVISLFTFTASAGWIHVGGYACQPERSEPGTCVWVDDDPVNRLAAPKEETDSTIKAWSDFIASYNPFVYFLK